MNKKKTIIAAIVLLLVLLVGGAIAYFTDTETKTNTFTIGNVDIELKEDAYDALTEAQRQNLMPGQEVAKDPIIKNISTANKAYVFAKVEAPCSTDTTAKEAFDIEINDGWYLMTDGTCASGKVTRIYAYGSASAMTELAAGASAPVLFKNSKVVVNEDIDGTETGLGFKENEEKNLNIVVTAYGIQVDGLGATTPTAVWAKF